MTGSRGSGITSRSSRASTSSSGRCTGKRRGSGLSEEKVPPAKRCRAGGRKEGSGSGAPRTGRSVDGMRTDAELMELYRRGSRDAFEEIYARHHRRVIHFCYRMTGDQARAEEAAQEVFLRIARAASTYQPAGRVPPSMDHNPRAA